MSITGGASKHQSLQPNDARPVYFISDLHLSLAIPNTVAAFEHFIENTANDAQAVYILGDLFEYWIGDDMLVTPFAQKIAAQLHTLAERGIQLYIMPGNRDFLLGAHFAQAAGATLLDDPCLLEAFNLRTVLAHGDALCTADGFYQKYRKIVRCHAVQRFFLSWPLRWRLALAARIRARSGAQKRPRELMLGDVTEAAVLRLLAQYDVTTMIHGHTHRPAQHRHGAATRWVLPDWDYDQGTPRGGYLKLDQNGIQAWPLEFRYF
ncbi:UDP-2,3-diacylglucosamine hydrolase [Mycoavidus cysteinexigens]|uniref:UDP-2,3-diacylglucosamine hydrolase n=1 Tax=Mycoavidus cysteinexigens TaxID=1553431 RepID=A0A2Z6EUU6_9BURK|nr:UDP-2,3-diacylglucosamine diphosphatase [Mycoavidus cysteinexigens]BBE09243.1 UDP-2,3-diacylglucosamine hydrolase [Mycoavidus cysteinexigens]GAM52002.1 UDP-2,3-diacylglucosamine diphosphatase [bacterium endosymbiont of Mortierella elongata FMR23-6]GLR02099.1 UDP-2,3-diacylglucosamine hydrolase [Mycoavidus cysteinexigens]